MAPRKGKIQGKGTNIKIKSKVNTEESELQGIKKKKTNDEPLEGTKWLKPVTADGATNLCDTIPDWFNSSLYNKHGIPSTSTMDNINNYSHFRPKDHEDKSTTSEGSDECDCPHSKYPDKKNGILKRSPSSTNSLVAHYIKSGMDHVASFIVESAIRFGQQHGVVVPDKNTPNLFEITPPDNNRKIRFKLPDKHDGEGSKKDRRRSCREPEGSRFRRSPSPSRDHHKSDGSRESTPDSLEEIIPLLKKLEEDGEEIVTSELDLDKLARTSDTEIRDRSMERTRDKYRAMEKRYKSIGDVMQENHIIRNYPSMSKNHWKRFKRDSLELGRQRLRGLTSTRKGESVSPSFY